MTYTLAKKETTYSCQQKIERNFSSVRSHSVVNGPYFYQLCKAVVIINIHLPRIQCISLWF